MSDNNGQKTFWKFLTENDVEIPIIQRDYAQGRKGKENLRKKFLEDLKNALDDKLPDNEKYLKLDFVYGSVDNDKLNPIDGQQRLTTLWLLHWFIAYKAGKLLENKNFFKKFTYETRISSREFCEKMSEFKDNDGNNNLLSIVEHIQNQTWFYSAWKQDPTIQAMLNMLDCIEKALFDSKDNINKYWDRLTSDNCPIIFYYRSLDEFKLSDDLYIKMNARGKPLTNFENFKADMIDFIRNKNNNIKAIEYKLDTNWTDIFWENRSDECKIDDIYFAFLNRYFFNSLIIAKKKNLPEEYLYTEEELYDNEKCQHETFKYLSGTEIEYSNFDSYCPKKIPKDSSSEEKEDIFNDEVYERLLKILDNFSLIFKNKSKEYIKELFNPSWGGNFYFIPIYYKKDDKGNENISILTLKQRVAFCAICRYFENINEGAKPYNETKFKQWLRVVWNIIESADIENQKSMISVIRLIDELAEYSYDIYSFLKDLKQPKSNARKEQVAEEIEKARQIINDMTNSWEEKIIEAERTAFFKGTIRFLFRKDKDSYDWDKFDDRFEKSKLYFDENGVSSTYEEQAQLLRYLISFFDEITYFEYITYDNTEQTWKNILTKQDLTKAVCNILDNDIFKFDFQNFNSTFSDEYDILFHKDLVCSKLLSKISKECLLSWKDGERALCQYKAKKYNIYIVGYRRNEILSKLMNDKIIVECGQKIEDIPYFWGKEIIFKCKDGNWYQMGVKIKSCLKKWNEITRKAEDDVKDNNGNSISIDDIGKIPSFATAKTSREMDGIL